MSPDRRMPEGRPQGAPSRVGTTVFGLPLYEFSYIGSADRFTGVMAQDVLGVMPRAVSQNAAGFYHVDYGMLGIAMRRAA